MKRYRNISSRHLQFALVGIELAPGQEVGLTDSVVKNDPGFDTCLERGLIEDLAKRSAAGSRKEPKKGSSKSDLFEPKDGQQPETPGSDDKKDS